MNERTNRITALINDYQTFSPNTSAFDQIELLDEVMTVLTPKPGREVIIHHWDRKFGCYDCGSPAAFAAIDRYGAGARGSDDPDTHLCAVCAANAAVDGETIVRILD
jgi:hypothetical protein